MKYFNWQKIQREALLPKPKPAYEIPKPRGKGEIPLDEIRLAAWAELSQICTPRELSKIVRLAMQYELGESGEES